MSLSRSPIGPIAKQCLAIIACSSSDGNSGASFQKPFPPAVVGKQPLHKRRERPVIGRGSLLGGFLERGRQPQIDLCRLQFVRHVY